MKFIAHAKLNLCLQIVGKRSDGYHLLESLFVFTDFGDEIIISEAETISLTIEGPYQTALSQESPANNLCVRSAKFLQEKAQIKKGAHIHLTKKIPVAAGLGGGSSDAAIVLIGLNIFWNLNFSREKLVDIALTLGADIPACLYQQSLWVTGIGEKIKAISLPTKNLFVILVNPKKPLSTQAVFQAFEQGQYSYSEKSSENIYRVSHVSFLMQLLKHKKNDLEPIAMQLMPEISIILKTLQYQSGCLLARMSGSGPTCFALFEKKASATRAEIVLKKLFPGYWILQTTLK